MNKVFKKFFAFIFLTIVGSSILEARQIEKAIADTIIVSDENGPDIVVMLYDRNGKLSKSGLLSDLLEARSAKPSDDNEVTEEEIEEEEIEEEKGGRNKKTRISRPVVDRSGYKYRFALRTNLLRWATLTPDLGLEWRLSPSCSLLAQASYVSWTWKNKEGRYALWEIAPEFRYHFGRGRNWYAGVAVKGGQFNTKLSETGKTGDFFGGGVTGGYLLDLTKNLKMDFNLGLGYIRANGDRYVVENGYRVRSGVIHKNWFGPTNVGVTLVWTLF